MRIRPLALSHIVAAAATAATSVALAFSGPAQAAPISVPHTAAPAGSTVAAFGSATLAGEPPSQLNAPVVDVVATPDGGGYWLAAADGGVFAFGDAGYFGSFNGDHGSGFVGMAVTADGGGYWLVNSFGNVYPFGDAPSLGSVTTNLNAPIVGIAATLDGGGYWLAAADGGIFAFGDAQFYGSEGGVHLNDPIVGIAGSSAGYWLVGSDGGVFAFGSAAFHGSDGAISLNMPVVGMAAMPDGGGYWLTAGDGGVFAFGDAPYLGSDVGTGLTHSVVAISTPARGTGSSYLLTASDFGPQPLATQPQTIGDCTHPAVEPATIVVTCADYGWILQNIAWTTWGPNVATGVGTFTYKVCVPFCAAAGSASVNNVSITLSEPVSTYAGVFFTTTSWTIAGPSGSRSTQSYTVYAPEPGY